MILPRVALHLIKKPLFNFSVAQIVNKIPIVSELGVEKLTDRFDIVPILRLNKRKSRKTHSYYSICYKA